MRVKKEEERRMKEIRRKEYGKATGMIGVRPPRRKRKGDTFMKRNSVKRYSLWYYTSCLIQFEKKDFCL